jgi:hypothetical protein
VTAGGSGRMVPSRAQGAQSRSTRKRRSSRGTSSCPRWRLSG